MHKHVFSLFRLVPVAFASVLIASSTGCIINANDFLAEGEGEDCVDLEETCPSLACEFGNVVVEGCEICECATETVCPADDAPPPDCENPVQLEDCRWQCGSQACTSDADCNDGFLCAFVGNDPAPGQDRAEAPAAPQGVCIPGETVEKCATDNDCVAGDRCENGICVEDEESLDCFSDADCFRGEFCNFGSVDGSEGAASDVAQIGQCERAPDQACTVDEDCDTGSHCEGFDAPNGLIPAPAGGICVLDDPSACQADQDCRRGQHCEYNVGTDAIVAAPGVCVDDTVSHGECEVDSDCNGGTCDLSCQRDPNCPECDVCFFVGTCIDTGCTADSDCRDGQFCDFNNTVGAIAPPDCDREDPTCQQPEPIQQGVCRDDVVPTCTSDEECGRGQFCDFSRDDAQRPAPCDPAVGCDPVPPQPEGICRDVIVIESCTTDADCARGEFCNIGDTAGRRPCLDENNDNICDDGTAPVGTCEPIVVTCLDDSQCAQGEFCDFGFGPENALIVAGGICRPLDIDTGCAIDSDCAAGEFCDFGDAAAALRPCLDENNDGACDDVVGNEGVCRPIDGPVGCLSDRECAEDQVCLLDTCNCPAVCIDDGNDGCVPCDCAPVGVCVDVIIDDICFTDAECGEGRFCNLGGSTDPSGRRAIPAAGTCEDIVLEPTPCIDDSQCRDDQVCVFSDGGADPGEANRPGRTGVCKAAISPCAAVLCREDTTCQVAADGTAACVPNDGR